MAAAIFPIASLVDPLWTRELIAPLRRELREGEDDTAAACEFLEILHRVRTDRST